MSNGTPVMPSKWGFPKPTHDNVIVDGVLRYPPTGLEVLVVGGGIGGYTTALECWRKGHTVRLVERNVDNTPIGDMIVLGPSATVTFTHYPWILQQINEIAFDTVATYRDLQTNELVAPPEELEYNRAGVPDHAAWPLRARCAYRRAALASIFYNQAKRLGIDVTFGVHIVGYEEDEKTGSAVADDGTQYTADIVIAADGLGTKSNNLILGEPLRASPTGFVACRVMIPVDELWDAPLVKREIDALERDELRLYSGKGFHTACIFSKNYINIVLTLPDDGTADESWSQTISSEEVLESLPGREHWNPLIIEAIQRIPSGRLVRWKVCWRDPQPKWTSANGRIVQVGDAAHSFISSSISGGTTAVEDSQSIAECLRLASKENANVGTKVHNHLRYQRVDVLQHMGVQNRRTSHQEGGMQGVVQSAGKGGPLWLGKWIWTHQPERYATDNFAAAHAHLETGAPFEHTNIPKGFKWEPWSMEEETRKEMEGIYSMDLKSNGDWSIY